MMSKQYYCEIKVSVNVVKNIHPQPLDEPFPKVSDPDLKFFLSHSLHSVSERTSNSLGSFVLFGVRLFRLLFTPFTFLAVGGAFPGGGDLVLEFERLDREPSRLAVGILSEL